MWKPVLGYGVLLALGALLLQWLDLRYLARAHSLDLYLLLIALAFLALGVFVGRRLFAGRSGGATPATFDGNPKAQASLGISDRELEVLREIAAGHSNKEIARRLDISPNTIKTHATRLFEKLGARRRVDAVNKGRELGLLP